MSEAMRPLPHGVPVTGLQDPTGRDGRGRVRHSALYCSVCTRHIWSEAVTVIEPEGVPEPRLSWQLCKACNQALLAQLERSPIQSPLRVRIAIGLVAAERWPHGYTTRVRDYVNDRRWIVFMAAAFIIAMVIHLMIIVMIATLK
ncbi:hypothetical protein ccbrp13_51800 [Ktedonobacteria bacterium brp13]|nr:hypothetical protein ccbrp13_51800 [Ktedonobacteria bacterium brp13]